MDIYSQKFFTYINGILYASNILKEYEDKRYVVRVHFPLWRVGQDGKLKKREVEEYFTLLDPYCFYGMHKGKAQWKRNRGKEYGQIIAEDILNTVFLELQRINI